MGSGSIQLKINRDSLTNTLQEKLRDAPTQAHNTLNSLMTCLEEGFNNFAPVMTGNLRSNTVSEYTGEYSGVVYTDESIDYAKYVILPTRPHWIGRPVYIFQIGWRYIGEHPGTDAQDYPEMALAEAEGRVDEIVDRFMDWIVD
jgi:hypothetical protein